MVTSTACRQRSSYRQHQRQRQAPLSLRVGVVAVWFGIVMLTALSSFGGSVEAKTTAASKLLYATTKINLQQYRIQEHTPPRLVLLQDSSSLSTPIPRITTYKATSTPSTRRQVDKDGFVVDPSSPSSSSYILNLIVSKIPRGGAIRYSSAPTTPPTPAASKTNILGTIVSASLKVINPSDASKIFVSITTLQTISFLLSPIEVILSYGLYPTPKLLFCVLDVGGAMANMVLFLGLCLLTNLDFESSLGYSLFPSIIVVVHKLLTYKYDKVGMNAMYGYISILLNLFMSYACLSVTADYFTLRMLIRSFGLLNLVLGVVTVWNPKLVLQVWNTKPKNMNPLLSMIQLQESSESNNDGMVVMEDQFYDPYDDSTGTSKMVTPDEDHSHYFVRTYGRILVAYGLAITLPAFDLGDILESTGWINVTWFLTWILELNYFHDLANMGIPSSAVTIWLFIFAIQGYALLAPKLQKLLVK